MSAVAALEVTPSLFIPRHELSFHATTGGGPGGQHVNRSATRVVLVWSPQRSAVLTDAERSRLRARLGKRVDSAGNIRVVASSFRSQARNRSEAERRLILLLRRALAIPKARKATRPSRSSIESRLRAKHQLSTKKRDRKLTSDD